MDRSEEAARNFIISLGYHDVKFEPDGNRTPDFLLDGKIAVEVRRLNQNFVSGSKYEGLELVEIPLFNRIQKIALSFGPSVDNCAWWISYTIVRPMPLWKKIEPNIKDFFHSILSERPVERVELRFVEGFSIDAMRASIPLESILQFGAYSDLDAGGFVVSEFIKNIQI